MIKVKIKLSSVSTLYGKMSLNMIQIYLISHILILNSPGSRPRLQERIKIKHWHFWNSKVWVISLSLSQFCRLTVAEEWTGLKDCWSIFVRNVSEVQRSPKAGSVLVQIHNDIIVFHIYTVTVETWRRQPPPYCTSSIRTIHRREMYSYYIHTWNKYYIYCGDIYNIYPSSW